MKQVKTNLNSTYQQFVSQVRRQCTLSEYCNWCQRKLGYHPSNYDCLVVLSLFQHDSQFVYTYRSNGINGVEHIFQRVTKK